ncbi:hypothetical protein ACIL2W_004249 [Vibrio parahaemolyticus]|uniref:hypothetical protein n=1 Tax=Vibrio parahaemolyticus TaxID=670 RepID=UPI000D52FF8A|nr:hypothetical protein [Vibrio parahaemolyticus]AWG80358.1 hypothetical protein C9I78_16990 [Vibrio parahaemolyticus]AWJ79988.1 hypothetical protein C7Y67_17105 [Vibrio parahaemolyticus]EJG0716115.1 hypothetical protein [Vibrio parahaemolyticus]EJY0700821.1 hypothetical protein [Vibrio parahaemolyticus]ELU8564721.1 hypothetical protein [Vibrio parahaemolyticus]
MSVEQQCYDAGIKAIQHIIETRVQTGKSSFQRLDEDKHVPFVVPAITWDNNTQKGSLNNEHWHFKVGYGFREALDLLFIERVRNKKKVYLWSQGCIISFKEGDLIDSCCGTRAVQVKFASPMGWDEAKNDMYYGSVTYNEMDLVNGLLKTNTLNQLEFLTMLIEG